jgi:hypothetical protein
MKFGSPVFFRWLQDGYSLGLIEASVLVEAV